MAGYTGYLMKGLASGIQTGVNFGMQLYELKWQKAQRKKLEEKEEKIKEGMTHLGGLIKTFGADKIYSDDEIMQLDTVFLASVAEVQSAYKDAIDNIKTGNKRKLEEDFQWLDLFTSQLDDLDLKDVQGLYDMAEGGLKTEKARDYFTAYKSIREKKLEAKAAAKPDLTIAERKFDWATEHYNLPEEHPEKIDFRQYAKYMGVEISETDLSALESKIKSAKQYGATNEQIKNMILGVSADVTKPLTPTPTSVENIREDIKNAPTIEDARRMEKNHIAKYGDTTGIPNVDKFWGDERVRRLTSLKQGIDKLLDEKKRLKKGTITLTEEGYSFEDKLVEEAYQQLREEYMKYRDMLEKMGVDVSQFPELMSYEEYLKADIKPGMGIFYPSTWGKQKPAIY